jgi:hypothetical protein
LSYANKKVKIESVEHFRYVVDKTGLELGKSKYKIDELYRDLESASNFYIEFKSSFDSDKTEWFYDYDELCSDTLEAPTIEIPMPPQVEEMAVSTTIEWDMEEFCKQAEKYRKCLFAPFARLAINGEYTGCKDARTGTFVVARKELIDFVNKYNHIGAVKIEWHDGFRFNVVRSLIVTTGLDRYKMPEGWLIVPVHDLPAHKGNPDTIELMMQKYEQAKERKSRIEEEVVFLRFHT